jgi:hypothetical protein
MCYSADPKAGEKAIEPLLKFGKPTMNTIKMQDYVAVQKQFDGPPLSEYNSYLKSGFIREMTPGLIDVIANELHADETFSASVSHFGGAIGDRSRPRPPSRIAGELHGVRRCRLEGRSGQ